MDYRASAFLMAAVLALAGGCSSETEEGAPDSGPAPEQDAGPIVVPDAGPACDPSRCLPGNICVQDRCMLQCQRHTGCPNGYDCVGLEGQQVCAPNGKEFGAGLFGQECGLNGSADCDATKGFVCIGAEGDPDAYCTKSNCTSDAECPGNYYCEEIDWAEGSVLAVCLKRSYCAPATSLIDCNDIDAVFATDDQGKGFCSRICTGKDPNDCGPNNGCYVMPDGPAQCRPRAGTCEPRGTFCSRCLSKNDCPPDSACLTVTLTKERFCATSCQADTDCPDSAGGISAFCLDFDEADPSSPQFCVPNPLSDYDPPRCWLPCSPDGCQ